ncbi:DUF4113 domain-containing protein [Segniliparus rugosus]|uniref:DUF4113 domain-containing protein n=1 Tax=Segniliparus rugosus TaxID=286804 RepID=UPI0009FDA7C8|nr:DUF4113 domain-containing protein [Segniliparus rugosus]
MRTPRIGADSSTCEGRPAACSVGSASGLGPSARRTWEMRRDFLSPAYTTRWDQLLVAGAL